VQVLRALLERHSEEEMREQLKQYDPAKRDALLTLLRSVTQLERGGNSPRDVAALIDPLSDLIATLRPRAALALNKTCFCSHIKNFGQYEPLRPDHPFQPGECVRVYAEVRNFASRPTAGGCETVLKGRLEIYDEGNKSNPIFFFNDVPHSDVSRSPRQDYWVNFRFQVPMKMPPGSYTVWIFVEDWTGVPAGVKSVPPARRAQSSLDFQVGGISGRVPRARIADRAPAR
jgi:hypothetical protein